MGSAKVFSSKPQTPMGDLTDKKSIKSILRKPFQAIFQRVDSRRRSKGEVQKAKYDETLKEPSVKPILSLLENLTIDKKDVKGSDIEKEIVENFEYLAVGDDKPEEVASKPSHSTPTVGYKKGVLKETKSVDHTTTTSVAKDEPKTTEDSSKDIEQQERECRTNEECSRNERIDSNSSNDSGYSDRAGDADGDCIEATARKFEDLNVEEGAKSEKDEKKKKKKTQNIFVSRGPFRPKHVTSAEYHPYQQISQINKQTFSGGQVIVKSAEIPDRGGWQDIPPEIGLAISQVDRKVNDFTRNTHEEQVDRWTIAQEFVTENQSGESLESELGYFVYRALEDSDPLKDFCREIVDNGAYEVDTLAPARTQPNAVDEFNDREQYFTNDYETGSADSLGDLLAFMTPPRSNEHPLESPAPVPSSPKNSYCTPPYTSSVSSGTFNSPNSYYLLSPERSSPNDFRNDLESYQDLPVFEEQNLPSCVDNLPRDTPKETKKIQRTSSITMRAVKDILKRLNMEFSKAQCCQKIEVDSKSFFREQFQKFSVEERKNMCLRVTNIELDAVYENLQSVLLSLGGSSEREGLHYALFSLLCERVLAQAAERFLGDFGLDLLKLAALRCPTKPILVRHLVRCIRRALSSGEQEKRNAPLYNEVDALGENLVGACARAGDAHADVLAELVRRDKDDLPLFDVAHRNTEGYSPLHVACLQDGAEAGAGAASAAAAAAAGTERWLRTIHVLLAHAHLDLTEGDTKGGDTPLHLAVNSRRATLELVLALVAHAPRAHWRQLAHCANRSSMTPLEYARSATKSQLNYPIEVLDFLKKCR